MFNLSPMKSDCTKLLDVFTQDLSTVRTGRAKPSLVENVEVEAYGSRMRLMELANISAPDSSSIVVRPWDKTVLKEIEKALASSELHIPPVVDGDQIRLSIPPLTGERRQELAKLVGQKKNASLEMLRDIRIKYKKQIDGQKGAPGISEDMIKHDLEELQKITDEFSKKLEEIASAKEKELGEM